MSADITKLREALERVEAATGPDHEVERQVGLALGWTIITTDRPGPQGIIWKAPWGLESWGSPAPWTSSLDAVVALVEREMPGARTEWVKQPKTARSDPWSEGSIWLANRSLYHTTLRTDDNAALALLAAYLRAKIAEAEQQGEDAE